MLTTNNGITVANIFSHFFLGGGESVTTKSFYLPYCTVNFEPYSWSWFACRIQEVERPGLLVHSHSLSQVAQGGQAAFTVGHRFVRLTRYILTGAERYCSEEENLKN